MTVTALIDKLTEIELSIGVENDHALRNLVIDAQDCALRVQAEIGEILRTEQSQDEDQVTSDVSWEPERSRSAWRRASAAILPLAALSPLWRR